MSDLLSKYASQQAETDISRRSLNLSSTTIHELTQLIPQFAQNKSVKTTHMTIQVLVHNLRQNQSTFVNHKYTETDKTYHGCTLNCVVHIAGRFYMEIKDKTGHLRAPYSQALAYAHKQHMHNTK